MRNKILIPLLFVAVRGSVSAAQITFWAGNPAVAADVNANFTELYNAKWTLTATDLSYSAGNVGIGVANPGVKFGIMGGTAVTLAGATGFGVFGSATGNHIAVDTNQIQAKSNGTTANGLRLNPLGGNVGIGVATPNAKLHLDGGSAVTLAGATGFGIIGDSAGAHMAISTTQIQAKGSATTSASLLLNPLGGSVGIGEAAPGSKLDVNGNVNVNGGSWFTWNNSTTTGLQCFAGGSCQFNSGNHLDHKIGAGGLFRFYASDNDIVFRVTESGTAGFYDASGVLQCTITAGVHNCTSDARLKTNILPLTGVLNKLANIRGVSFYKKNAEGKFLGVIAQEVHLAFPELVSVNEDGYLMVQHTGLFGPIIQGINELKSEKDTQVLALEKRAAEAEQKYAALLKQMQHEKAQAEARAAKLELRLARLEASLEKNRVVARR